MRGTGIKPPGKNQKFTWGQIFKVIQKTRDHMNKEAGQASDKGKFVEARRKLDQIHGINTFMIDLFAWNAERKGEL